ncbi:hypothetical protein D3C80_1178230 [compost metagenome]
MNSWLRRPSRPLRRRMCGSSKALALRRLSSSTASPAKRALSCSRRWPSSWPCRLAAAKAAKSRKRVASRRRRLALLFCGKISALTSPEQRMPRPISSTRHSACMKAPCGSAMAGRPISAAV